MMIEENHQQVKLKIVQYNVVATPGNTGIAEGIL